LQAVGNDGHNQLGVTVEEGDRPVAGQLVHGLAILVHKTDDSTKERSERCIDACILKGGIEDTEEDRGELLSEGVVEFIRDAVVSRGGAPPCCSDGRVELEGVEAAITVSALCQICIVGGEGAREGIQQGLLGLLVNIGSRAEEASGRISAVESASVGERRSYSSSRR